MDEDTNRVTKDRLRANSQTRIAHGCVYSDFISGGICIGYVKR